MTEIAGGPLDGLGEPDVIVAARTTRARFEGPCKCDGLDNTCMHCSGTGNAAVRLVVLQLATVPAASPDNPETVSNV